MNNEYSYSEKMVPRFQPNPLVTGEDLNITVHVVPRKHKIFLQDFLVNLNRKLLENLEEMFSRYLSW